MSDTEPEPATELSVADMRKVMASILDVLECPICYQELYSPIYQCNNGHPVCSSCRPRVRACPVCKSWMYHVRALTLEKIVREMPRPCRYLAGGCTERLGAATRAQHERCCPRRPARCVEALVSCGWKGPLPEARAHLWAEHELASRLHCAMHGRFSFSVGCVGQEKFLEDTAESVLFRCLIRAERGQLHFLCHALVAADRAELYVFRVLVTNRCSERRLSYEGPVPSVFQSVVKTIEASQGLRVGRDWLLKACSCRAGELCFDTTWQLSRRSELAQAERDLRTILAGAYPEPHGGHHDQAVNVTPCRMRPEAREFTPSGSRQETPGSTLSGSRLEIHSGGRVQTVESSASPSQQWPSANTGRCRRILTEDREEPGASAGPLQEPGASLDALGGCPDVSISTHEEETGDRPAEGSMSSSAGTVSTTSDVSAACYAAAVTRLAAAITSHLTDASRNTEVATSQLDPAPSQPAIVATRPEIAAVRPAIIAVRPEIAAVQPGTVPETASAPPEEAVGPHERAAVSQAAAAVPEALEVDVPSPEVDAM